ncbi:MAG: hypothetical protein ACOYNI_11870 [Acidimicrobiia bacterium]
MVGSKRVRQLLAVSGVMGAVIFGATSGAGAQTPSTFSLGYPSVAKGQYSEMNPLPHAAVTLGLARHYGDTSHDAELAKISLEVAANAQLGKPLNLDQDRRARKIASTVFDQYAERLVIDAVGGQDKFNLARVAAKLNAPADCSNDLPALWGIDHKTELIRIDTAAAKATVSFTLDKPLCQPVTFELQSWKKVEGKPWPAPQVVNDVQKQTVQNAGTYNWTVELPTQAASAAQQQALDLGGIIDGLKTLVCAAQVDFTRSEALAPEGVVVPSLIDYAQLDSATPEDPQFAAAGLLPSDVCVQGEQVTRATGGGSLPNTGAHSGAMALTAAGLIALGWLCLAGRAAMDSLQKVQN